MVRSLATPLEGRGSPKKLSRTGVRTPKRTNQSGAGFGNPAPDLETCVPGSGKFFRAAPTLQRRSQTTYHSEKPKFNKIGQVAEEQHLF